MAKDQDPAWHDTDDAVLSAQQQQERAHVQEDAMSDGGNSDREAAAASPGPMGGEARSDATGRRGEHEAAGPGVRRRTGPRRWSSAPVSRFRGKPLPTFMLPPDPFDSALPSCPKQAFLSVERGATRGLILDSDQFGWSSRKTLPDYYYQNAGTTDMPGHADQQADEEREARRSKRKDRQNLPTYNSPRCFANPKNNSTLLTPIMETKFKNGSLALTPTGRIGLVTEYTLTNNASFRAIRFDLDGINGVSDGPEHQGQAGRGYGGQGGEHPGDEYAGVRQCDQSGRPDSGRESSAQCSNTTSSSSRRRAQLPFYYGGKRPGVKSHSCLLQRPMTT